MSDKLWPVEVLPELLLVYGQAFEHGDAQIHGTPAALRRLGAACIRAAASPEGKTTLVSMMATDGEGYAVSITPQQERGMSRLPNHYCQERAFD